MPRVSIFGIRFALGWLVVGALAGVLTALQRLGLVPVALPVAVHWHWMLFGWMTQLALSIAWWILPRFPGGDRGPATRPWLAICLLNLAQLSVLVAQLGPSMLELAALVLYLSALLPRVSLLSPRERAARGQI